MRASRLAVAFAVVGFAGAAHAQSIIPGNQVDDFGSFTSSRSSDQAQVEKAPGHASIIAGNQVDDFGSLAPSRESAPEMIAKAPGRASMIPGNQIDDFGTPSTGTHQERSTTEVAKAPASGTPTAQR